MAGSGADPQRLARAQALMAAVPESTYRRALAALVDFDRRADLARIAVPTWVVTGAQDRTAAPEVAQRMAVRIPGAECAIIDASGHLGPMEMPDPFNRLLTDFLARRVLSDRS
jgi:pimeloyl-ACP methyl ester carboxylesterase